jgi:uncharacterized repeat protein (TIGR02543 family)
MKQKHQNQKSVLKVLLFTSALFSVCVAVDLLNPPTANAQDTSSLQGNGMGLLENEWIKVGVNKDRGTFGSGHLTSPGILFDPTGSGNFDTTYDYLSHINDTNNINTTSNIPHDGFALKVDGTNKTNNNQANVFCGAPFDPGYFCTDEITGSTSFVDGTNELTWTGSVTVDGGTWIVENAYSLLPGKKFIQIQTSITAGSGPSTVYFAKYTDPDPSGVPADAFSSNNKLGHAGIPPAQIAFAEATVSGYAIGLYSAESNVNAGIDLNIDWVANPVTQADKFNDVLSNDYPGNGDDALGLTFTFSDVDPGDVLTFCHAYVFGTSFDDAVIGSACSGTLTYNAQGGSGAPGNQTGNAASNVTVSSTVPTRAGYTFTGWDTIANGSGTDYAGGATYTLPNSGTDTLYAQWQINTVTLTYNAQGGSGAPGNQTGNAASNVTVSSTVPTRTGYTFTGWDTVANGSGTDYAGGATYTLPNSGTDTLYAQWQINTVTLTYNAQGGSGAPGNQTGNAASNVTVSSTVPTRTGHTFAGWDTAANGSGTDYAGGATYTLPNSGTATLYARWTPISRITATVTLTYDPRGGTGQPGNQTGNAASNVTVSSTVPTRAGYTFTGWDTVANGSGTDYAGGATYTLPNSGTATLYARWTPAATIGVEPTIPVPLMPALFLLLTSLCLAALGIKAVRIEVSVHEAPVQAGLFQRAKLTRRATSPADRFVIHRCGLG